MNLEPGARGFFVDLALAFLRGAPAGSVEQTLGTSCDRADPGRVRQDTFPAGAAIFLEPSDIPVHPDEDGVQSREDRLPGMSFGKKLDSGSAGHGQQGFIALGNRIQLRIKISVALSLYGKSIRLKDDAILLQGILELLIQKSDFPLPASHTDGCTSPAAHIQNLLEGLHHLFDLIKRLSFRDDHFCSSGFIDPDYIDSKSEIAPIFLKSV
jgi:hypothetical protein